MRSRDRLGVLIGLHGEYIICQDKIGLETRKTLGYGGKSRFIYNFSTLLRLSREAVLGTSCSGLQNLTRTGGCGIIRRVEKSIPGHMLREKCHAKTSFDQSRVGVKKSGDGEPDNVSCLTTIFTPSYQSSQGPLYTSIVPLLQLILPISYPPSSTPDSHTVWGSLGHFRTFSRKVRCGSKRNSQRIVSGEWDATAVWTDSGFGGYP